MSLKSGENVARVSNSLDLDETPSYLAAHPDPTCLHNCGTFVVIGGLRVKLKKNEVDVDNELFDMKHTLHELLTNYS